MVCTVLERPGNPRALTETIYTRICPKRCKARYIGLVCSYSKSAGWKSPVLHCSYFLFSLRKNNWSIIGNTSVPHRFLKASCEGLSQWHGHFFWVPHTDSDGSSCSDVVPPKQYLLRELPKKVHRNTLSLIPPKQAVFSNLGMDNPYGLQCHSIL